MNITENLKYLDIARAAKDTEATIYWLFYSLFTEVKQYIEQKGKQSNSYVETEQVFEDIVLNIPSVQRTLLYQLRTMNTCAEQQIETYSWNQIETLIAPTLNAIKSIDDLIHNDLHTIH